MSRPKALRATPTLKLISRFEAKVERGEDGHWRWLGAPSGFSVYGAKTQPRRVAWWLHKGSISAGMVVVGSCEERGCVNPEHAQLVPYAGASAMSRKRRTGWQADNICPKGHLVEGDNIKRERRRKRNGRFEIRERCRRCHNALDRAWHKKQKASA